VLFEKILKLLLGNNIIGSISKRIRSSILSIDNKTLKNLQRNIQNKTAFIV